jgi:hypothetical protein
MNDFRVMAVAVLSVILVGQPAGAQELSRYRDYALGSSVAAIVKASGTRADETKTLHERPARIQELQWRAPYVSSGTEMADPVRDVLFSFFDDQLYQLVVTYDRDRMEGLTNEDVIESISATYGTPLLQHSRATLGLLPPEVLTDTKVVAQWEDEGSLMTLTRGTYAPQYQLVMVSKALNTRARAAIKEAGRLDVQEAPQREVDQRKKEVSDARVADQKARVVNKAAFKP